MCRLLISWKLNLFARGWLALSTHKDWNFYWMIKEFLCYFTGFALASFTEEWRLLPWNMALVDVTKSCIDSISQVCRFFFFFLVMNVELLQSKGHAFWKLLHYLFICLWINWILPYKYPMQRLCLLLVQHIP